MTETVVRKPVFFWSMNNFYLIIYLFYNYT